ncbi:MAG TPA: hypothetical protein PKY59_10285 [Pyrinomonadaceae bacterium]|nr:hypothetical protein [Pyrinomonadaceae bacterium]
MTIEQRISALATQIGTDVKQRAVPSGGTTGQVLAKASNANFDSEWIDAPSGGGTSRNFNGGRPADLLVSPEISVFNGGVPADLV